NCLTVSVSKVQYYGITERTSRKNKIAGDPGMRTRRSAAASEDERGKISMSISERARNTAPSPTLAITAKANALKAQGKDVVGFGAGEPDFDTPDYIKQAAIDAPNAGYTKYTPSSGAVDLKDAVIAKLQRDNGLQYARD